MYKETGMKVVSSPPMTIFVSELVEENCKVQMQMLG